jgi:hypothetical protein
VSVCGLHDCREYVHFEPPLVTHGLTNVKIEGRIMVDFQSFLLTANAPDSPMKKDFARSPMKRDSDSDFNSGSSSESEVELSPRSRAKPRRNQQDLREPVGNRGCECDQCTKLDLDVIPTTYRIYDDVDPGKEPPNRDHFFSLCSRDLLAFSIKEHCFGK